MFVTKVYFVRNCKFSGIKGRFSNVDFIELYNFCREKNTNNNQTTIPSVSKKQSRKSTKKTPRTSRSPSRSPSRNPSRRPSAAVVRI